MILFDEKEVEIVQGRGRHKIQTIREISNEDLAYIAGFVDGEGTISILRYNRSGNRNRRMDWRAFVGINNTNKEVLEWIRFTVGAGNINANHRKIEGYKTVWKYNLSGSNSILFSKMLLPYLKIKRTNALILIELGKTLASSYVPRRTPEHIQEVREKLTNQIQLINQRGLVN